jgi:hypothetical protein
MDEKKQFFLMRQKLLGQSTPRQSQVESSAATADIDNDQNDDRLNQSTEKPETKPHNYGKKLYVHYKHEKRFQSCKRDMHRVYEDVFKNTPAIDAKLMVSNRNRRDAKNELICKRPEKTLLNNTITKSKYYSNIPIYTYIRFAKKQHIHVYLFFINRTTEKKRQKSKINAFHCSTKFNIIILIDTNTPNFKTKQKITQTHIYL